jgi:hypothetical protein
MHEINEYTDASVEFYPNFFSVDKLKLKKMNDINFYNADDIYEYIDKFPSVSKVQFKSTLTGFDSSSRNKKKCNVILGTNPDKFKNSLRNQIKNSKEEFVFINAWNEWSESAVLEPSVEYKYLYLKAVKNVTSKLYL